MVSIDGKKEKIDMDRFGSTSQSRCLSYIPDIYHLKPQTKTRFRYALYSIVFCDGCNLAVRQDCYGVPYILEGQRLRRKRTVLPENPVVRVISWPWHPTGLSVVPGRRRSFQADSGWVHLLCAIWVPPLVSIPSHTYRNEG